MNEFTIEEKYKAVNQLVDQWTNSMSYEELKAFYRSTQTEWVSSMSNDDLIDTLIENNIIEEVEQ